MELFLQIRDRYSVAIIINCCYMNDSYAHAFFALSPNSVSPPSSGLWDRLLAPAFSRMREWFILEGTKIHTSTVIKLPALLWVQLSWPGLYTSNKNTRNQIRCNFWIAVSHNRLLQTTSIWQVMGIKSLLPKILYIMLYGHLLSSCYSLPYLLGRLSILWSSWIIHESIRVSVRTHTYHTTN